MPWLEQIFWIVKYFPIEHSVHFLELFISTIHDLALLLHQLYMASKEQFAILDNTFLNLHVCKSRYNIYETQHLFFTLVT